MNTEQLYTTPLDELVQMLTAEQYKDAKYEAAHTTQTLKEVVIDMILDDNQAETAGVGDINVPKSTKGFNPETLEFDGVKIKSGDKVIVYGAGMLEVIPNVNNQLVAVKHNLWLTDGYTKHVLIPLEYLNITKHIPAKSELEELQERLLDSKNDLYMTLQTKILQELQDPNNRKIVNEGQPKFGGKAEFNVEEWSTTTVAIRVYNDLYTFEELMQYRPAYALVFMYRCINLLPCFDSENPEYQQQYDKMRYRAFSDYQSANGDYDWEQYIDEFNLLQFYPKTIRQALLQSGAMTLEELESEYKELIK